MKVILQKGDLDFCASGEPRVDLLGSWMTPWCFTNDVFILLKSKYLNTYHMDIDPGSAHLVT